MKSRNITLSIFILFISFVTSCGKSYNPGTVNPPPTGSNVASVTISGMTFSPATLTVKTGTTIVWKNNDGTAHTATSNDGSTFNTGNILAGYSGTAVVNTAGNFTYHCQIHSNMTGTIIVTPQ
ncbi:MAG: cupredoxin domain-containing protein [Ginsengibacter sp.]